MNDLNKYIEINISKDVDSNKVELSKIKNSLRRILELVPENSKIALRIEHANNNRFAGEIIVTRHELKLSSDKLSNQQLVDLFDDLIDKIKSKILTWNSNRVFNTYLKDLR